ncbi:GAF and ANTAR domain-containing protein [Streptomyces sp. NPDC018693]|uniref:GAF and ANTAR domain-containing protein n=1 Tax=unclassified Streptomyces TaxID=2593676 RepID=UPI0037B92A70
MHDDRDGVGEVIADELRDAGPGEVPDRLCAVAARLLPVSGVGVSLSGDGMPVPLGASGARIERLMEVQVTLGEGPCVRAAELGAPVYAVDLTGGRDAGRWPVFALQAVAVGVRAVYALPLGHRTLCVGTLDLYCDTPDVLTDGDLRTAHALADATTAALMTLPRVDEPGLADDGTLWPSALAADHGEVYQAVGMVMVQLCVDADEALARLRARAFAQGRTMLDLAHELVDRRVGLAGGETE